MHIADTPSTDHHSVMRGRARITDEFTISIALFEREKHHTVEWRWHPYRPRWAEVEELAHKVAEATAPYLRKAMQLGGIRVVGDA